MPPENTCVEGKTGHPTAYLLFIGHNRRGNLAGSDSAKTFFNGRRWHGNPPPFIGLRVLYLSRDGKQKPRTGAIRWDSVFISVPHKQQTRRRSPGSSIAVASNLLAPRKVTNRANWTQPRLKSRGCA